MRIAVNTRLLLSDKLDGIGWFTWHTLKRITAAQPETEFIFFFDRKWDPRFVFGPNVTPVALFPQARHPFLYYLWFEHAVPSALRKYQADLFLSPDGYLSLSTKVKQVPVIHDLNFEHYPKDLPLLTRSYYRHYFPLFASRAARIATVSEFSKQDIIQNYHVKNELIDVVYNGVNELYHPADPQIIKATRDKYTGGAPYFLFVGMLHQRKNIANLFRAFEKFRESNDTGVKLLIVGHKKWWTAEMERVFEGMKFKDQVIFTGRMPIEELVKVVGSAFAMTYISVFEGFGVPIIESMKSGVPVITSNVTSMPEVADGAALLTDPFDVDSISATMGRLWNEKGLKDQLVVAGLKRADDFSWIKTSDLLWSCITRAIQF
jgi:glycosyltransferase involved in cell wall biosynthesis